MGIVEVLEKEFEEYFWSDKGTVKVKVHCSCGRDYSIKEKKMGFPGVIIRPTICPQCREESYLRYEFLYDLEAEYDEDNDDHRPLILDVAPHIFEQRILRVPDETL